MKPAHTLFQRTLSVCCFVLFVSSTLRAQASADTVMAAAAPRFEHIAINVPTPLEVVKWYSENLGFSVLRQGAAPGYSTIIADSARNMALEVYRNTDHPWLNPQAIHHMAMHFAFAADSILEIRERLLKSGATEAEAPKRSASGGLVFTLRDPWGFALQFVERTKPMLKWKGLFAEHFGLNVEDSRAKAKWFAENLGTTVVREGKAPSYGMFIADAGGNLMMELYHDTKYPALKFADVDYMATHLAFAVTDVKATRAKLVAAGATVAEEMKQLPNGDTVLMLRDPWGEPVQIVKRVEPMLK